MSPLLFAIILELLLQRLIEAKNEKKIDVYKMVGIKIKSYLAFANDVVLFCRANEK